MKKPVTEQWIPKADDNCPDVHVTVGKAYDMQWCEREEEHFIVDDEGVESLIYLVHDGEFVKVSENMTKHIYRVEVSETSLPKRMDWYGDYEEEFDQDLFGYKTFECYFPYYEEVSQYINLLTKGYHQYWADPGEDIYGEHEEYLEYHNGRDAWDKVLYVHVSQVKLVPSLLEAIKRVTDTVE